MNRNPPVSLFAFVPLALLNPWAAAWAWYVVSLGCALASIWLLWRAYPDRDPLLGAWALSLYPLWGTLHSGQFAVIARHGRMRSQPCIPTKTGRTQLADERLPYSSTPLETRAYFHCVALSRALR